MFEIIDFHIHPFLRSEDNICRYPEHYVMAPERIEADLREAGISRCCGSVIRTREGMARAEGVKPQELSDWDVIQGCNRDMWAAKELLGDFYVPGMMVHPGYVAESLAEMEKYYRLGVRLVGELTPYFHGWEDYACGGFSKLLDGAAELGMVVSLHSMGEDAMDAMAKAHPGSKLVFAHPGDAPAFRRHLARMGDDPNFYLDLSGTGLFRHGLLRTALDVLGRERVLFGTDYPICAPCMFVGGVVGDPAVSREEKEAVLAGNARRLFASVGLDL